MRSLEADSQFRESFTPEQPREETIDRYKELIRSLPPVNQYLLLYVLDLLHVFANNAEKNLMTAPSEPSMTSVQVSFAL